ncbi:hypothetical protein DV735_g5651, partial [Chaetothyriales sp. CBS 134920]
MEYASFPPSYPTTSTWRIAREDAARTKTKRKGTKARAWSEAEEQYLLQSRRRRIQYKGIASRLQKSELACRLHYHQLTKLQPPAKLEAHGSSNIDDRIPSSSTPAHSTNVAATTIPAVDPRLSPLKLPSLAAMIDEVEPTSLPRHGNAHVPLRQWEQHPCPPGYILPPPRGLRSPFDETRLSHYQDGPRYHTPAISQRWNPGSPHCMGSLVDILPRPQSSIDTPSTVSDFPSYLAMPIIPPPPPPPPAHP